LGSLIAQQGWILLMILMNFSPGPGSKPYRQSGQLQEAHSPEKVIEKIAAALSQMEAQK
jgi:hypothetical protein